MDTEEEEEEEEEEVISYANIMIYKLGFNQNYYTFTLILLIKIVVCSKFP